MHKVKFTNFRCFADTPPIEIRPITFLVGENSAGKTSFLAGARYLMGCFARSPKNPFNSDPYYLGGFEQIAHYRGGRGGRAKGFSLSIDVAGDDPGNSIGKSAELCTHLFSFVDGSPQPNLHTYTFSSSGSVIRVSVGGARLEVSVNLAGAVTPISYDLSRTMPTSVVRENSWYVRHIMDELYYTSRSRREKDQSRTEIVSTDFESKFERLWESYRMSIAVLGGDVFASAPVRTQPLRTYTPSELAASSEGSHMPLELSRAKLKSPEEWRAMKQALVSFGKRSGLFSDIDIRHLGKSLIDPFQLLVKINGPAMNLVDVGYGISQVLPIVYQMQHARQYAAFLLQQPEVHLHPRAQAELGTLFAQVAARTSPPYVIVETHSDYIIDRLRIEIQEGRLKSDNVTIVFFRRGSHDTAVQNIYFTESGELLDPPADFRSFFLEEHSRLLGV
jgi:predicted ATPase